MLMINNSESDKIISGLYTKEYVEGKTNTKFLANEIQEDIKSKRKEQMRLGNRYYNEDHDILKAEANKANINGQLVEIAGKSNYKPVHDFHTLMVDQKKDYLLNKGVEFSFDDSVPEQVVSDTLAALGDGFNETMESLVLGASNKAEEWLHYLLDENGDFDYVVIPAEQIIPYYDGKFDRRLEALIRYYKVEDINVETGIKKLINKAEVWTDKDVTFFIESGNGYVKDKDEIVNPRPHIIKGDFLKSERDELTTDEIAGWGKVPFIPLYNNTGRKTDLQPIKSLIDLYDDLIATGANTVIDLQEAVWAVKGYDGEDVAELAQKLKKFKVINLEAEEGAGIEAHQLDIPYEARKDLLDKTKDSIYEQGRGVDTSSDEFGNNPSGISIRLKYADLDIKCNSIEMSLNKLIKELLSAILFEQDALEYLKQISWQIPRATLINEAELTEKANESMGVITQESIWEAHPLVKDVDREKDRWEKQEAAKGSNIDFDNNSVGE